MARFDAFISYSHGADARLAPELQRALHRFAKPWYRARAVRIFRDQTNLHLTQNLPETLTRALDDSAYLLLLASPGAAKSPWVEKEVSDWLAKNGAKNLLIILTEGDIAWDGASADFDWRRTTALPVVLKGRFADEPLHLDLRWTKSANDYSTRDPRFLDAVARISAALRNTSLDQIAGEDVRQHRRTRRIATAAVVSIALFALAAVAGGLYAWRQERIAVEQRKAAEQARNEALASQSRFLAETSQALADRGDFEQAALLLLEALPRRNREGDARPLVPEAAAAMRRVLAGDPLRLDLRGHQGAIRALVSPREGEPLVSLGGDGTVRVWDPKTGNGIRRLSGEDGATMSADGRFAFLLSGWDVEVWSLGELRRLRTLEKVEDGVNSICVSADGTHLVAWTAVGEATVWSTETGAKVASFSDGGRGTLQQRCLFSADGRRVASVWLDGFRVWDVVSGEIVGAHEGSNFGQLALLDRDGRRLVATRTSGAEIDVRDVASGKRVAELSGHGLGVTALAFDRAGARLASGGQDNTVRIWDLARAHTIALLQGHESPILHAAFSADGALLASGGQDRIARIWDTATGRQIASFAGHDAPVTVVAFAGTSPRLLTGTEGGTVRVWEVRPRVADAPDIARVLWTLSPIAHATLSPDGRRLLSAEVNSPPRIRDAATLETLVTLEADRQRLERAIWSPGARYVAAREHDGRIRLWRARDGALLATLSLPDAYGSLLMGAEFDAAENRLLLWGSNTRGGDVVALFELPSGRLLAQQKTEFTVSGGDLVKAVAFVDQSPVYVTVDRSSAMLMRSLADGSVLKRFVGHGSKSEAAWFTRDGKRLISIAADGGRVWDVATGEGLVSIGLGPGEFVVFPEVGVVSGDGRFLATHAHDNAPRIWDLGSGRLVATLRGHAAYTQTIAFSPDASMVATAASDGHVMVWHTATGERIAAIPGALAFPLTVAWSAEPRRLLRVATTQATATLFAIGSYSGDPALDLALLEWRTTRALSAAERKRFGLDAGETPRTADPSCASLAGHPLDTRTRGEQAAAVIASPAAAIALCRDAVTAAPDDPRQRYRLARALLFAGNHREAAEALQHPSLAEYPSALYLLARLFADGQGVRRDSRRALALYEKAHTLGDLQAGCAIAALLRRDPSSIADRERARAVLEETVRRASPCGHAALVRMHLGNESGAPAADDALYHAVMGAKLWERAGFSAQAMRLRAERANLARRVSIAEARAAWERVVAGERRP